MDPQHLQRAALGALTAVAGGCGSSGGEAAAPPAEYVDEARCAACHADATEAWTGSHHDRAMQVAGAETVLGDFDDAIFEDAGVTTRFFRRDGAYFFSTAGADGRQADFEVAYTFGVDPLQQYLVEFPGGRLQALTVAWDVARERWYDLYPDQRIPPDDPLHWTGRQQNWNAMCAECHSTGLVKGYDSSSDSYDTTWARIDVGCQACHGPGSEHVRWAEGEQTIGALGLTVELQRGDAPGQIDACAPCHSRRSTLVENAADGGAFLDRYAPSRLVPGLYHADGQILGEVYVYGSFLQSTMFRRGVACTDCHDPHGLGLLRPGNAVCTQCHTPDAALERFATLTAKDYDTPEHHFHEPGSEGALCVSCHMPERTYMGVDPRRDHAIRVPRPDLTEKLGTPNACNGCHADRSPGWAAAALEQRFGPLAAEEGYAERFFRAESGAPSSLAGLIAIAGDVERPAIVRATALERLAPFGPAASAPIAAALSDADALVRASALHALSSWPPALRVSLAAPLLLDPLRHVRTEAGRLLAPVAATALPEELRSARETALAEYRAAQELAADMAGANLNLALLSQDLGRADEAEAAYRRALSLDPFFLPACFNLATLLNARGRNAEAERVLREGIARVPDEGELHLSLGLLLAELGQLGNAEASLTRAALLLPESPRAHYNRGLTLQHLGRRPEAEAALLRAHELDATDPDFQNALAIFYLQDEDWARARRYAQLLVAALPGAPGPRALLERARRGAE